MAKMQSKGVEVKTAVAGSSSRCLPERSDGGGEGGSEGAGWAASDVIACWAAVATVVATGVRSSKGIRDCGSKGTRDCDGGNCPVSVTTDVEQGGAAVGKRAGATARRRATVVAWGSSGWKATVTALEATALEATAMAGNKGRRCELPVIALFRLQKMQSKGSGGLEASGGPARAASPMDGYEEWSAGWEIAATAFLLGRDGEARRGGCWPGRSRGGGR